MKEIVNRWWIPVGIVGGFLGGFALVGLVNPEGANATVSTIQHSIETGLKMGAVGFYTLILKTGLLLFVP